MKVVINKCYGGFDFSDEFKYHLLLNQPSLFEKVEPKDYFGTKKSFQEILEGTGTSKIINDFGDFLGVGSSFGIYVFYNKAEEVLYKLHESSDASFRSNPILIKELESFGLENASGNYAKLAIVEIPDGISFQIQEYDGKEWVAESHQTWG